VGNLPDNGINCCVGRHRYESVKHRGVQSPLTLPHTLEKGDKMSLHLIGRFLASQEWNRDPQ
jgi:hypothetical protein